MLPENFLQNHFAVLNKAFISQVQSQIQIKAMKAHIEKKIVLK